MFVAPVTAACGQREMMGQRELARRRAIHWQHRGFAQKLTLATGTTLRLINGHDSTRLQGGTIAGFGMRTQYVFVMSNYKSRKLRIFPMRTERFRIRSEINSGSRARGIFAGTPSTNCDGTFAMKSSGALARLCS